MPSCVVHDSLKVEGIVLTEVRVGEKGMGDKMNAKGPNRPGLARGNNSNSERETGIVATRLQ